MAHGSAENLRLLRGHQADLAQVQGNVADEAHLGIGAFADAGPDYDLRALASLFPEPGHLLVAKDSPIRAVRDLAGKRVEVGQASSGSRANAVAVLGAAGLALENLGGVGEAGLESGLERLTAGALDAVIATISAPARPIQEAAAAGRIRILSLSPEVQDAVIHAGVGWVRAPLPPATYPGQRDAVNTLAVTALLAAPAGLPKADVDRVLQALFERIDFVRAGPAVGSLSHRATGTLGLTVPLHPAALAFFGAASGVGDAAPPDEAN